MSSLGLATFAAACSLAGCAAARPSYEAAAGTFPVGEATLFQQTTGPMSMQAATPRDAERSAPRAVRGEACQHALTIPLALVGLASAKAPAAPSIGVGWDDGGYTRARAEATARAEAKGSLLYDVRADVRTTSVLGVWTRRCVEIHAWAAAPVAPTP